MTLGKLIGYRRVALGMTLDELAEATKSSKSYCHDVEKDKVNMSFTKAVAFSIALNLSINTMAAHTLKD